MLTFPKPFPRVLSRRALLVNDYSEIYNILLLREVINVMAKKNKKNCYAIHLINDKKDMVVKTWAECQNLTKGRNNMFKGFMTEQDAWEWLKSITEEQEKKHDEIVAYQKEIKRIKQSQKEYRFRLDERTSRLFQEKLERMHMKADEVIKDFVREYIGEE